MVRSETSVVPSRIANETELIQTYLAPLAAGYAGAFGLADDAALISPEPGMELVISTDPIIAGVHFFNDDAPADIAWKALAVNVSDLAAKGARPFAYTMALAFPDMPERAWMEQFRGGLAKAQTAFGCHLIGGDTDKTSGPLSISITVLGSVPKGQIVRRSGAKAGDHVFVSGTIGDSALGLRLRRDNPNWGSSLKSDEAAFLLDRYLRPQPRVQLGPLLPDYASASLDISDGLLKDVRRLASDLSLTIAFDAIPLSPAAKAALKSDVAVRDVILSGGDDYELVFAVPASRLASFRAAIKSVLFPVTEIGILEPGSGVAVVLSSGVVIPANDGGYDHFSIR